MLCPVTGEPMISRKEAAYIAETTAEVLSVIDCTKKYDLQRVKASNGRVYYRRSVIAAYRCRKLKPERIK